MGTSKLPNGLKKGDIKSLFKSGVDAFAKENYRPTKVLLAISKIYEQVKLFNT